MPLQSRKSIHYDFLPMRINYHHAELWHFAACVWVASTFTQCCTTSDIQILQADKDGWVENEWEHNHVFNAILILLLLHCLVGSECLSECFIQNVGSYLVNHVIVRANRAQWVSVMVDRALVIVSLQPPNPSASQSQTVTDVTDAGTHTAQLHTFVIYT